MTAGIMELAAAIIGALNRAADEAARRMGGNAERTADIIGRAEGIKGDAETGRHTDDLRTMARQLHQYGVDGVRPRA